VFPADEVYKIIICFNSRLNVHEETDITKYAASKKIAIELIGLDWLALEIYSKYLILAKDILGIPLDTGQMLPLKHFIDEYNNKAGKLSTPLDNVFLHRKVELGDIQKILNVSDLLIISGFPGVGKTKIALEAIEMFVSSNPTYKAFAISKKDQDISEDLKIHLQTDDSYILLVDDANRQLLNFKQILGVFKEKRKGKIKLIITVRDYALSDIERECVDYLHEIIALNKFTDDEITELISSNSFNIKNPKYQKKIVEIADGNARLAVMASRLAMQEQVGFLQGDGLRIYELYDYYFRTFINDNQVFGSKILIKVLGVISFFYTIDRRNREFIDSVLKHFELDYNEFNESIDILEEKELIEVKYNNAKVSEQVMSTYFFYKIFIKDEILSFKKLMFGYFHLWDKRFKDTIIPANNAFGYDSVLSKIKGTLDEYLHSIYTDEEKVLHFFDIFWFYKREELLSYYFKKISNLPEPVTFTYSTDYETNDFVWDRDRTLDMLSNLFGHYSESFVPSVELAFEFCRKNPESLPELIRRIREKLLFDDDDHQSDFIRQVELFNLIIAKLNDNQPHYRKAFFALSSTFLGHSFQITKGGRNHSIIWYDYPLPFYEVTREFRENLWKTIFKQYELYPNEVFTVISNYSPGGYVGSISNFLEFDLSLLVPFIDSAFDSNNFQNIYFVNDFVHRLDKQELNDRGYKSLRTKFTSAEYESFRKMDWNMFRGKEDYEFEKYEEFHNLKEQDIRDAFVFKTKSDFAKVHQTITNGLNVNTTKNWELYKSLEIIAEENFIQNNELGFNFFESILNNPHKGLYVLYKPLNSIIRKSPEWALKLWGVLKKWEHPDSLQWKLTFFECLPDDYANSFYKKELLKTVKSIHKNCQLRFENFEKFVALKSQTFGSVSLRKLLEFKLIQKALKKIKDLIGYKDKHLFIEILSVAYHKIETLDIRISLSHHFFEKYSLMLTNDIDLLCKCYIQQYAKVDQHFDFDKKGMKILVSQNKEFLITYIKFFFSGKKNQYNRDTHQRLSFVWDLEDEHKQIEDALLILIDSNIYLGIGAHPTIVLFNSLTESQEPKAKAFLLTFISKYYNDDKRLNPIFHVIRHLMKDFFEEAFLHYLSHSPNVDVFEKVWWRGNGGTYSGEVIIGEIQAKEWQDILAMAEKGNNQLELIPIKAYIKKQIDYSLRSAEEERKRKFVNPSGF
jgi:hypothetical protein